MTCSVTPSHHISIHGHMLALNRVRGGWSVNGEGEVTPRRPVTVPAPVTRTPPARQAPRRPPPRARRTEASRACRSSAGRSVVVPLVAVTAGMGTSTNASSVAHQAIPSPAAVGDVVHAPRTAVAHVPIRPALETPRPGIAASARALRLRTVARLPTPTS